MAFSHFHRTSANNSGLILLPPGINSRAGQRSFGEKKEIYKDYHLLILNEVVVKNDWTTKEIEDREEKILDFVEKTWG